VNAPERGGRGEEDRLLTLDRRILALLDERAALVLADSSGRVSGDASSTVPDSTPGPAPTPDPASVSGSADAVSPDLYRPDLYRPEREAARRATLLREHDGALPAASLRRVFGEIESACRALGRSLRVACLGPEGTYSEAATFRHFGHAVETLPEKGIPDIFRAVENGRAAFGVVPVENSTEGVINHTLDLLMETPLRICGEVRLRIEHRLLVRPGTTIEGVVSVHAHPQALAQCRRWLDAHLPGVARIAESSNAVAAERALGEAGVAAIAGETAAERYGLDTLEAGIEDVKTNTTRFLVIGDRDVPPSGDDTTSLLLSAPHRPGGLRRMLQPFEDAGLSLTRIESRPARAGLWEYVFFIDVAGHRDEATVAGVLERLVDELPLVRVLGSYPRAS